MTRYIFLFDLGNTNIKLGVAHLHGEHADVASYTLPTEVCRTADEIGLRLLAVLKHAGIEPEQVADCAACSVVPWAEPALALACNKYLKSDIAYAHRDFPVPLENKYERPMEVGADRLMTAYAAYELFPAPAQIVVDFGTATTFDCVKGNAYMGGVIGPGIFSSLGALAKGTAKLPHLGLDEDAPDPGNGPIIGRSTKQSMRHGLVYGFASMTDGLVQRLKPLLGEDVHVAATGGPAALIGGYCSNIQRIVPDLLLEGLLLLYRRTK